MLAAGTGTTESGGISGNEDGNVFQWVIPCWLTFDGWYVNQDESGNTVTDKDAYTKLTDYHKEKIGEETYRDETGQETTVTVYDEYYTFTPNPNNPNPVIEARWKEEDTYPLVVTLMPGADDVKYTSDADAALVGMPVTEANAMTATGKTKVGEQLELYIPEAFYERKGYHFNQWLDAPGGKPIELSENGTIVLQYEEGMEDEVITRFIYAQWTKDDTGYAIPAIFEPGEHATGDPKSESLSYNTDADGGFTNETIKLPDADSLGFVAEEGWEFEGWRIEGDDTLYKDAVNTSEFVGKYGDGDAIFVAQWKWVGLKDINYTVSPGQAVDASGTGITDKDGAEETDRSRVLEANAEKRTISLPTTKEEIAEEFGWVIPESFKFLNWTTGSDFYVDEEEGANKTEEFRPTEGMTLIANWTTSEVETWKLEYDAGEGDDSGVHEMPVLIHRVDSEDSEAAWTVEVRECSFEAPEGKEFAYWTLNGRRVYPGEKITIHDDDGEVSTVSTYAARASESAGLTITLIANWKDKPDTEVNVYFRDGGGSGFMQSEKVTFAWNESTKTYTFPACTYTGSAANPTFAGWKYTVKGVRNGKPFSDSYGEIYQPGDVITLDISDQTITSIEVTAQWKPKDSGGGAGGGFVPSPGPGGTGTGTGTSVQNPVETPAPDKMPANGSVSADVDKAARGDTVTVTPTPESGYLTGKVVVTDKNGKAVEVRSNGDGTYSFEMPDGGVTVTAEFVSVSEWYIDVSDNDLFRNDVAIISNYGLMIGVSETDFGSYETATRAQMMTILTRRGHVSGAWDGGNEWYKASMEWAMREGVSDGTRPFDPLTREEIVTMLYRFVGAAKPAGSETAAFTDDRDIDSWARDAMEWAVETGILLGDDVGTLRPRDVATRAELAAILARVMRFVKEF